MPKYANQRLVTSKKASFKNGDTFLQVLNDDWMAAGKNISQFNTFKLYLFFARHQPGYEDDYSPAYAQEVLGIGRSSCDEAFKNLIKMRYIKEVSKGKYEFYTTPYEEEKSIPVENDGTNKSIPVENDGTNKSIPVENKTAALENDGVEKSAAVENKVAEHHEKEELQNILSGWVF